MGPFASNAGPDRFSTTDEIRAALSFPPKSLCAEAKEGLWEVASDLGGYVRIDLENDEGLTLLERLDPTVE
jgi:hypothetical protein